MAVLKEFDEEIIDFQGDNLFDEGLMDSLTVTMLVANLENEFCVEINASDVTEENFKTVDTIVNLLEKYNE